MEPLNSMDRANLGEGVRHAPFLDALNASGRWRYALGGGLALGLGASGLGWGLSSGVLSGVQSALVGFGALLVGLALLRAWSRRWERRLLERARRYAEEARCEVSEVRAAAWRLPWRWTFARDVLGRGEGERPLTTGQGGGDIG